MPYLAKTAHEGLQRKLDKSAAAVHNQFPGAKVQKTNINMRSMYKAAQQLGILYGACAKFSAQSLGRGSEIQYGGV